MGPATDYVQYLGTDKYTSEQLQQEFYKIGIDYSMSTSDQRTFVRLSGLKENLDAGLALIEHFLQNMQPDQEAYDKLVASVLKSRANNKTQKGYILQGGLVSYAQYGEDSRLRDIYSSEELKTMDPQSLVDLLKSINTFPHKAFYYGKDHQAAVAALDKHHQAKMDATVPEKKEYKQLPTGNKVYYVDYDMVQAEVMMLAKADPFNPEKMAAAQLFNTYFGSGLSSIVFQEIRESKSLAYSAYASYSTASRQENSDYVFSYIGTQANKLPLAVDAMMELMTNMPEAKEQFEQAKEATLKKMAARRITKSSIFWNYERMQRLGLSDDHRKKMYETIKGMTFDDLSAFFNQEIKGNNYTTLVIGNKQDLDMDALQKLGEVEEMQLDDLFNYR
jgi:Predicted Zn-dependent peptidases